MICVRATTAFAPAGRAPVRAGAARRGFTLIELLITMMIIGIMSSMVLFAMWQSQETAKAHRTRALITKLNSIIMRRYDEYRTRRVPFQFPAGAAANNPTQQKQVAAEISRARLDCLRDLMRMEMPDRWTDVTDNPVAPFAHTLPTSQLPAYGATMNRPAISEAYLRKHNNLGPPSDEFQGAECLYMIVMESLAQEGDARDFFKAGDIGDIDNDGFPEFLDAWNRPIRFLRWAPGLTSGLQVRGVTSPVSPPATGGTYTCTVTFNGAQFNTTPGSYVGGVMAALDASKHIDGNKMGQIVGYQHSGTSAIFTFETAAPLPQPFGGTPPQPGDLVAILNPDPFDSRGVYPGGPSADTHTPNFGLTPLIYSGGPDRAYGISTGSSSASLHYSTIRLNPCYVYLLTGALVGEESPGTNEPQGAHVDNITNHQLGTR